MNESLIQLFQNTVDRVPDKDAVVQGDRRMTYAQLWMKACGIANFLVKQGLEPGDRVALLMENSPEYVATYYGILMAGGAATGLNTASKARDLANWVRHSESTFIFVDAKHNELEAMIHLLDKMPVIVVVGDDNKEGSSNNSWHAITEAEDPPPSCVFKEPANQLAAIIYTSGTTGQPKGVMLSHLNLYKNVLSILEYLKLSENDSIVNVLPFYYSYGNSVLHIHLAAGATIFLENSMLYPQKVVSLMADNRVTGFSGVPSTFNLLLSRTRLENFDLSSIRYMTQAGGPMAPVNIQRLKTLLPHIDFYVMYGQTEASARLSYLPPDILASKPGSIGVAIPGVELEIMNDEHVAVSDNVIGEIYAKGDNIMMGYWKDTEATQEVMYGGWLKTGDLGYKDEDGYLYVVGRSKEMIKSGAHRISPKDIEEVILEIEGIEEAAVVGVDDDLLGQVIKAVVVISPGAEVDKMHIMRHCKINLANYKLPKLIEFAEEIPRTASGKVRRFMLQRTL